MKDTYYMTDSDFNSYLRSIDGLININSINKKIISRNFFEIDNGWLGIVKELIDELIKLGWNREISQCKEKFGILTFYTQLSNECADVLRKAQEKSYTTCEKCGAPGKHRGDLSWKLTLCEDHYSEKINETNGKQYTR